MMLTMMRSPSRQRSIFILLVVVLLSEKSLSLCEAFLTSSTHCHWLPVSLLEPSPPTTPSMFRDILLRTNGRTGSCLYGMLPRRRSDEDGEEAEENDFDDDDDDDDTFETTASQTIDLEAERKRLESLLGGSSTIKTRSRDDGKNDDDSLTSNKISEWKKQLKKPPPLTTIGREILEAEITLLESLVESNDAMDQFWSLWYNARGPGPANDLMETEALVAQATPEAWKKAEELLRQLITREGVHWVEPVNRLATLMFLQSRFQESKDLCEIVLTLKPWHFGALSGIVMVCQGLNDKEGMMEYAGQRMPPLSPKAGGDEKVQPVTFGGQLLETRFQWVDRMLDLAQATLLRGEMGLDESFQDCDKAEEMDRVNSRNTNNKGGGGTDGGKLRTNKEREDEDDVWQ
jgi:hypothetical protein